MINQVLTKKLRSRVLSALNKVIQERKNFVFVYETLLDKGLRRKLLKKMLLPHPDHIIGYREISVESNEGTNYHTLVVDKTSSVLGLRFEISDYELHILDQWEDQYSRKKLLLHSGNMAWIYFLKVENMANKGHNLYIAN